MGLLLLAVTTVCSSSSSCGGHDPYVWLLNDGAIIEGTNIGTIFAKVNRIAMVVLLACRGVACSILASINKIVGRLVVELSARKRHLDQLKRLFLYATWLNVGKRLRARSCLKATARHLVHTIIVRIGAHCSILAILIGKWVVLCSRLFLPRVDRGFEGVFRRY